MKSRRRLLLRLGGLGSGSGGNLTKPTAPELTVTAEDDDGEVTLTVDISGVDWGDATVPGDSAGTLGTLEVRIGTGTWAELVDPAASDDYILAIHPSLWGTVVSIQVRGVNAEGVIGRAASDNVLIPGPLMELVYVLSNGVQVVSNGVEVITYIPVV